jgi:hypothetical protein
MFLDIIYRLVFIFQNTGQFLDKDKTMDNVQNIIFVHIVCLFLVLMAVTMKNRDFLLCLLFYPEEGSDLLLRNIYRLLSNYVVIQFRGL